MPNNPKDLIDESIFDLYKNQWEQRNVQLQAYFDFYFGNQKDYLPRFLNETINDYAHRKDSSIVENHCKGIINTQAALLYGDEVARWIENRDTGEVDKEWQEFFEKRVWEYNDMKKLMMDRSIMQGLTGFCVVTKKPDMIDGSDINTKDAASINTDAIIRYDLLDSQICMPLPKIVQNGKDSYSINPREFSALVKAYSFDGFTIPWIVNRLHNRFFTQQGYLEYIDDKVWKKWKRDSSKDTTDGFGRKIISDSYVRVEAFPGQVGDENPYGSVKIPFTLFKNPGDPMLLEGESDIHDIIPLNVSLNERLTDDRNTLAFCSYPILTVTGAPLPEGFVVKPGAGLELPINAKAEWLTWNGNLESSIKQQEILRDNISRVSSTSDLALGGISTGQLRSGLGLKGKFSPDLLRMKLKLPYIIESEIELIYSTMEMFAYLTKRKDFNRNKYKIHIEFSEDVLKLDETSDIQVDKMRYDMGITDLQDLIVQANPELAGNQKKIDELIKSKEDRLKQQQQQMNAAKPFGAMKNTNNKNGKNNG